MWKYIPTVLTLVMFTAKIFNISDIPWLIVFAPLLTQVAFAGVIMLGILIIAFFFGLVDQLTKFKIK